MARDVLVVLARAPDAGLVKTRIAAELGPEVALAAYGELARASWQNALEARRVTGCRLVVCYTPASEGARLEAWLNDGDDYAAQSEGDLGARMGDVARNEFAAGARRVVLMGTDCPALSASVVCDAFDALETYDVVIGPAVDGGYYLIGMSRPNPAVFEDVPWSTSRTLRVTLERANLAGLTVCQLDTLRDVDTAADWTAWLER